MLLSQINSQFGTIQRLQLEKLVRSLENSPNKNEMEKLKECGSSMPLELLIELALKGTISTEKPQSLGSSFTMSTSVEFSITIGVNLVTRHECML